MNTKLNSFIFFVFLFYYYLLLKYENDKHFFSNLISV
jgi:hypothetical protein